MKPNQGTAIVLLCFPQILRIAQASAVWLSAGAEVNYQANNGTTALIVADWNGNKEVAQLFLAAGADTTIRVSQKGGPLHKGSNQPIRRYP